MLLELKPGQIEVTHVAFDLHDLANFTKVITAFLKRIKILFAIRTGISPFGTTSHQMLEQVPDRNGCLLFNRGSFDQIFFSLTRMVHPIIIQLLQDLLAREWLHFELELFVSALWVRTPSLLISFLDIQFDGNDALLADYG